MKKKPFAFEVFLILIGPVGSYIGFYPSVSCKPSQAGFWVIMALGMGIGAVIARYFQRRVEKIKMDNKPEDKAA